MSFSPSLIKKLKAQQIFLEELVRNKTQFLAPGQDGVTGTGLIIP